MRNIHVYADIHIQIKSYICVIDASSNEYGIYSYEGGNNDRDNKAIPFADQPIHVYEKEKQICFTNPLLY